MIKYEGINPHIMYAEGAIRLAERGRDFREAERIARDGLKAGKEKIDSQKEIYETVGDYARALDWMSAFMYDALGVVYMREGRLADAEKQLTHARDLDPSSVKALYHLGQLAERRSALEDAERFYAKGSLLSAMGSNPNRAALKQVYQRRHGSLDGFDTFMAGLADADRASRRAEIAKTRDQKPAPLSPFSLKTLEGRVVSLDSLRGKTTVINNWGMWCGPCVAEMPDVQKLATRFASDSTVRIITIDNDPNTDELRSWMDKKKIHVHDADRRRLHQAFGHPRLSDDVVRRSGGARRLHESRLERESPRGVRLADRDDPGEAAAAMRPALLMSRFDGLRHRLYVLWRGDAYAREVEREIRFHVELDTLGRSAGGLAERDAELAARRALGNSTYVREEVRRMTPQLWIDRIRQDATYALRGLRRSPGFTLAVVLTLGLGIGVNAAMFSLLDRIFLQPPSGVAVPGDVRRLYIELGNSPRDGRLIWPSIEYPQYRAMRAALDSSIKLGLFTAADSTAMRVGNAAYRCASVRSRRDSSRCSAFAPRSDG